MPRRWSFPTRLCVRSIVLVCLHVGSYVTGRHKARFVAEVDQFPSPMMSTTAGLEAHETTWKPRKEIKALSSGELLADDFPHPL